MVFYITRGNDTVTQTDITDAGGAGVAASNVFTGINTFTGVTTQINSSSIILGDSTSDIISILGTLRFYEQTDPSAPSTNQAILYIRDNGAGKTQLCVRFATGAIQVIATQP